MMANMAGSSSVDGGGDDDATVCKQRTLADIPVCRTKAGPRDGQLWMSRLKEEYNALIKVRFCVHKYEAACQYVEMNKLNDTDWFRLESNADGTRWFGRCWHHHNMIKYQFDVG
jgi:ufm1-conjugating enzyme 1